MNRTKLLQGLFALTIGTTFPVSTFAEDGVKNDTKIEVSNLLEQENTKKVDKTKEVIGTRETETFRSFFSVPKDSEFVEKVEFLQKEYKITDKKIQGIIDAELLKKIYIDFYSKNLEVLSPETKKRWEIYQEMLGYSKKGGALYAHLNVFSQNDYYGKMVGVNKEGTLVNENLLGKIPETIAGEENKIIVSEIEGKKALSFYVGGKLFLATYVSPGALGHKTPKLVTKGKNKPDKYHTSSEFPEAGKKKNGVKGGAVMPYAVHIDGGVWVHGSDGRINGEPQSHGCVRTPLLYVKEIYEKVSQLGIDKVTIDTTGIY